MTKYDREEWMIKEMGGENRKEQKKEGGFCESEKSTNSV
jgi:hypothetical protein